jgi:adenylylsulfate kinase
MKILIFGLPGSGKTTLANELVKSLDAKSLNADEVRKEYNDWDFSSEGRTRQAKRMRQLADEIVSMGGIVVVDFVCPTRETRKIFDGDFVIYLNTIKESRFEDTNKMFEEPNADEYDFMSVISLENLTEPRNVL